MKNKLILIGIILLLLYFIRFPQDAFTASCSGILLWFEQILPSLLPYSILSNIILASDLFSTIEKSSSHKSAAIISPAELFVIIFGFAFGFPIGSRLAADLCAKGIITKDRAQLLAAFTNNMSPAFVCNYVLTYSLNRSDLQLQTLLFLYGIPLIYGLLGLGLPVVSDRIRRRNRTFGGYVKIRRHNRTSGKYVNEAIAYSRSKSYAAYSSKNRTPASRFHIDMQIVDAGITQSFETLIRLCGYIVIFSILAQIIRQFSFAGKTISILLTGILEVTNGIGTLPASELPEHIRYLLALGFLSFGGISGIAQTGAMIKQADLSLREYCRTKLIITILVLAAAAFYVSLSGAALCRLYHYSHNYDTACTAALTVIFY